MKDIASGVHRCMVTTFASSSPPGVLVVHSDAFACRPIENHHASGSTDHAFIDAPVVLDYMDLKWGCSLPSLTHITLVDYSRINEGFRTCRAKSINKDINSGCPQKLSNDGGGDCNTKDTGAYEYRQMLGDSLLRSANRLLMLG